jgi:hypothetical protein
MCGHSWCLTTCVAIDGVSQSVWFQATGLATLLRGTRYHAQHNTLYLPLDLMREYRIAASDLILQVR